RGAEVLEQERDAAERAVGQIPGRRLAPLFEERMDDGVDLGVELLDPRDRPIDQLGGARLPGADELGLFRGVHAREVVGHRRGPYRSFSSPTVNGSGSSGTRRTARTTPGMNERRSIESWRMVRVWPSLPKITSWWATRPGRRTEWIG